MASTPPRLPTILCPGAFTTPATFAPLLPHLEAAGFPYKTVAYPSSRAEDAQSASVARDVAHVRSIMTELLREGRDVVVFAHSYVRLTPRPVDEH